MQAYTWQRKHPQGYECSSRGDARFSALNAMLPDGRTIEMHYQCDVKGYDIGGSNWRLGKGKLPLTPMAPEAQWQAYLNLWRWWAANNVASLRDLYDRSCGSGVLTDMFATSPINQARALSVLINEALSTKDAQP